MNKLKTDVKSHLVSCLEDLITALDSAPIAAADVIVLDGATVVNMLRPGPAKTFDDCTTYLTSDLGRSKQARQMFYGMSISLTA